MICECGKEFECNHVFEKGGIWCNHCFNCNKGHNHPCKGDCPTCFKKKWDEVKEGMEKFLEENSKPL